MTEEELEAELERQLLEIGDSDDESENDEESGHEDSSLDLPTPVVSSQIESPPQKSSAWADFMKSVQQNNEVSCASKDGGAKDRQRDRRGR